MTDILDIDATSVKEPREYPPAEYVGVPVNFSSKKVGEKQTTVVEVEWKIVDPLSNVDLDGVNRNRNLRQRVFVTADSLPYVKERMRNAGIDVDTLTKPKQWFDAMIDRTFKVRVAFDSYYLEKRNREVAIVDSFEPMPSA